MGRVGTAAADSTGPLSRVAALGTRHERNDGGTDGFAVRFYGSYAPAVRRRGPTMSGTRPRAYGQRLVWIHASPQPTSARSASSSNAAAISRRAIGPPASRRRLSSSAVHGGRAGRALCGYILLAAI